MVRVFSGNAYEVYPKRCPQSSIRLCGFLSRTVAGIKGIEFTLQYIGAGNFAAVAVADNGQPDPCNVNDLLGDRSTVNAVCPKLGRCAAAKPADSRMYTFGNKHGPPDAVEGAQCVAPVVGLKNRVLPNAVNHGVLIGKNNLRIGI